MSVNKKCVTKEYSYLIILHMCKDHFPINARATNCAIERNKMHGIVKTSHEFDLLVNFQLFKPDDVHKRQLLVKTGKKI